MAALINPETGQLGFADDPTGYVQQGWRVATPEEARAAAEKLDFGTPGQTAQALGERVVRGATLGAVRGFGAPEDIQARAEQSQEQHPVLALAADVAPAMGLAALTGGAAAAAGAGELGVLGAESAATGLSAAAQGAYARGQYLGEDPGRDAENALLWGGLNFGLGAATRAMFGRAAVKAPGKVAEPAGASLEDVAKVAEAEAAQKVPTAAEGMHWEQTAPAESVDEYLNRMRGQPAEDIAAAPEATAAAPAEAPSTLDELSRQFNEITGLPTRAPKGAPSAAAAVTEETAVEDGMDRAVRNASQSNVDDFVEKAVKEPVPDAQSNSLGRQRFLYQNRRAIMDAAVPELESDLGDVVGQVRDLTEGGAATDFSEHVGANESAQRVVTNGIARDAADLAGTLQGQARAYAASIGETGLRYEVEGSKGLVFNLMENAKALEDAETSQEMFLALSDFHQALQDVPEGLPKVGSFASQVRQALEDSAVWGKAGEASKAYNAVVLDRLTPSLQAFDAVGASAKKLLTGADLGPQQQLGEFLDAAKQLSDVHERFGGPIDASKLADQVDKIRRTLKLGTEVRDASQRMQAISAIAGHVPVVGRVAREWISGDMANAFRALSGATDDTIDRGVDSWLEASFRRGGSGSLLGTAVKAGVAGGRAFSKSPVAQFAARQGITQGLAKFMGQDASPTAAFNRARDALQSDQAFFEYMGNDFQSLQQQSPQTFMMASAQAANARAFLLQRMPANVSVSALRPNGYPPARDSIEDWSVYWNAVRHPMDVVANVKAARIQELQTLENVYPRLYERLQQRVLEKVGDAQLSGKRLDDAFLMRLGVLFNTDGVATPAFSRAASQLAQAGLMAQQAQQQGQPPGKPSQAGPTSGPVQGIAQSGATFGTGF